MVTSVMNPALDLHFRLQVVGSEQEASRILLCQATAIVMRQCFSLLGITPLYKI